ncbi:sigma-54-dependent Fis family transcriptional regulator [Erythrobacter sp. KY5]|uniref:sigma-54 interaction domain-containing protein n=1 Tax=Erythrobacter sp. KY5 TaxID=2011159 RepID=UPI001F1FEAA6|nr:sigma 54-interacting transcriptional regulator [Erythrobacter sp. KY5]
MSIGPSDQFAASKAPRPAGAVAVDLVHAPVAALCRNQAGRVTLAYNPAHSAAAQPALLASAAPPGLPIAGDTESLALLTLAERIAKSAIPVLLEGPTGTGKEVMARFVHTLSDRCSGPFVAVNCAAMPEAMLEGLLFGHRKGAFTGAGEAREGLFRAADGGSLLLDEIGELPLALQAKLLRTLQEGEVLPLGATKPVKVDVRIIAATNRTLVDEVARGRFREDLLYRLNVFPLTIPALRDRRGDIAPLAFGMLLRHACKPGGPTWISGQAMALLEAHPWAGNVRELENVIRRAILLAGKEPRIGSEHIVFDQAARGVEKPVHAWPMPDISGAPSSLSDVAFKSEAQAILNALQTHGGHRGKTARSLGISERTLRYRLASMRESGLIVAGGEA